MVIINATEKVDNMNEDPGTHLLEQLRDNANCDITTDRLDFEARQLELQRQRQSSLLQDLLRKNAFVPIHVPYTFVDGGETIRPNVLIPYFEETIYKASNLNQLLHQADILYRLLISNQLADSLAQTLETTGTERIKFTGSQIPSYLYENDAVNTISVLDIVPRLNIKPIKHFSAKTGTNIGNGEGDGYLQFQWRNVFGGGEKITFDATKGTKTHSSYLLDFSVPYTPWWSASITGFKNSAVLGSLEIVSRGARACFRSKYFDRSDWNHEFIAESILRSTSNSNSHSSDALLLQCGDQLKQSISHCFSNDSRDNTIFPSRGRLFKFTNELALGSYWKSIVDLAGAKSWCKDDFFTVSTSFRAGYIFSLSSATNLLHVRDKFQSGGANDVRGFQLMGLGPRDIHDSLGGNAFLSYGVSVFSRLPIQRWASSGFRLHYFLNGGRLINHSSNSIGDLLTTLADEHSLSTGIGILFKHPAARFELNFSLPLTAHSSDVIRKGFQYGIGISFL